VPAPAPVEAAAPGFPAARELRDNRGRPPQTAAGANRAPALGGHSGAIRARRKLPMTLCPIAIAVGCKKCPIFSVCPVKSVIGDYMKDDGAKGGAASGKGKPAPTKSKK
jgi:hypothetical protein